MRSGPRQILEGAIAIATGVVAGYLANSPSWLTGGRMWLPDQTFFEIFEALAPIVHDWPRSVDWEIAATALISAIPSIVVVALVVGLAWKYIRYPRLLMYSILAWPIYFWFTNMLLGLYWRYVENHLNYSPVLSSAHEWRFGLEMVIILFKSSILFLLIFFVHFAVIRFGARHASDRKDTIDNATTHSA